MATSNESNGKAHYHQGTEYYFANRYEDAIIALTHALALNPDDKLAFDRRGSAYKSLKQYDRALQDYNRALEIDSTFDNAYRNRGHVFRHISLYRSAIADFERAKKYCPSHHDVIDKWIQALQKELK